VRLYPEFAAELAAAADERLSAAGVRRSGRRPPLVCGVPLALKDLYAVRGLPPSTTWV
jgi:aspartyl-tRNA(Asn)/glutamyl-tRNA(Gln) amidotransferase subunit A